MSEVGARVLLVDNYDSFTFNLFQLLAEVTKVEPTVVSNDHLATIDLDNYDCVVLSPGPGTPLREADFGICSRLLAESKLPLLGVCLGHQGIGVAAGATLELAPEVRHGLASTIEHYGDPLFSGIPRFFRAIRYHSLALIEPLPSALECIARSDTGVVMGLKHASLPQWGVQFHPESIETEHGRQLLRNFCSLSQTQSVRPIEVAVQPAESTTPTHRVYHRRVACGLASSEVFARLFSETQTSFWLDGADRGGDASGFSFMGDASGPHAFEARYDLEKGRLQVCSSNTSQSYTVSLFDYLERHLSEVVVPDTELPFEFCGGFVGYLGYEMKAECGGQQVHASHLPDAHWIWADRFVAIDHAQENLYFVAVVPDGIGEMASQNWFNQCEAALKVKCLRHQGKPKVAPTPSLGRTEKEYLADIDLCLDKIRNGESYELCLTSEFVAHTQVDPTDLFLQLRDINPAPYAALLRCGEFSVVSSSPECFLRIRCDGTVESRPIKGTIARHGEAQRDQELAAQLLASEKEHAENLMIVDLVRNDLGRSCKVGSVVVSALAELKSYATVHQLVSTIRGTLRTEVSAVQCIRNAFPGGSMTGAPKLRSMEILDSIEGRARGVYSGSIGYLSCNGAVDLNIVIRTLVVESSQVSVGVGGAIIALSDPQDELAEVAVKAAAPMQALAATCAQSVLNQWAATPIWRESPGRHQEDSVSELTPGTPAWSGDG